MGVGAIVGSGLLVFAGLALGASSYSDPAGDANDAPDVTSVAVSKAADGTLTITIAVANFQTLPTESWFNLWFDLDSNDATGAEGDEALVRYNSTGALDFLFWNGSQLVARPPTGMTGTYAGGVLTLTAPESAFGGLTSFGILAVGARAQILGSNEFISSDFAPDSGRSAFAGSTQTTFPDPGGDQDAAPDITSIRVSDAKDGWISFAVTTANYETLPPDTIVILGIDADNRAATGEDGADLLLTRIGGRHVLERWDPRAEEWVDDPAPTRVRVRNARNVVTVDLHRSELADAPRFGFSVTTLDFDLQAEIPVGVDFAPRAGFFRYTLANKPALVLRVTRVFATPSRPQAGKRFTVGLAVVRSDTNRGIASGNVLCRVQVAGKPVRAKGSVAGGAGRCAVAVPEGAAGARLRGSITVRVQGKSVSRGFSYVIR